MRFAGKNVDYIKSRRVDTSFLTTYFFDQAYLSFFFCHPVKNDDPAKSEKSPICAQQNQ
jgi:hypothetical protein